MNSTQKLIAEKRMYVWEDGNAVSVAATHREVSNCRFIGYVYTPPHLRGHGYASACVYHLTKLLLTQTHPFCALYIDCAKPDLQRHFMKRSAISG